MRCLIIKHSRWKRFPPSKAGQNPGGTIFLCFWVIQQMVLYTCPICSNMVTVSSTLFIILLIIMHFRPVFLFFFIFTMQVLFEKSKTFPSCHFHTCLSHWSIGTWNPHFTVVLAKTRVNAQCAGCMWPSCLPGGLTCPWQDEGAVAVGCRWVSLCSPLAAHSHHQPPSSLMSPLGTLDLPPRGPFTWLTKVRKQTFFLVHL